MRVLVTGGAGYIGSHTLLSVLGAGHEVLVYDNFSNSAPEALERVRRLSNRDFDTVEADIRDDAAVERAVAGFRPQAVIHFAGLKAVGESTEMPVRYYDTNVGGTLNLLAAMDRHGCGAIVFSSSATVYGEPDYLPYDEAHPTRPASPYGRTKLMAEQVLGDWAASRPDASAVILRYFNPVGAHLSGQIGEDPRDIPNNLMPIVAQVAVGQREKLMVWGNDYDTPDGTGQRDYIHVVDLAEAHAAALDFAERRRGAEVFNIGTGQAYSVLEMVAAFEKASGRAIPYEIGPRRAGDIAAMLADPSRAHRLLGWKAERGLKDMVETGWAWQSANPRGYSTD
ncbi:MAG: UDP-glucose 4-epimerase GalE [Paracoccaceae bacterium]